MNRLKTRNFWFLVLNISICISFGAFTAFNQFKAPSKIYAENLSEKSTESNEKSSEPNHFFIQESAFEIPLALPIHTAKNLREVAFSLPTFWLSPNIPPPDLG